MLTQINDMDIKTLQAIARQKGEYEYEDILKDMEASGRPVPASRLLNFRLWDGRVVNAMWSPSLS